MNRKHFTEIATGFAILAVLIGGAWLEGRPSGAFRAETAEMIEELNTTKLGHIISEHRVGAIESPLSWFFPHTVGYTVAVPDPLYGSMGFYHVTSYTEDEGLGETYLVQAECNQEYGNSSKSYSTNPYWDDKGDSPRNFLSSVIYPELGYNEVRVNGRFYNTAAQETANSLCAIDWRENVRAVRLAANLQ